MTRHRGFVLPLVLWTLALLALLETRLIGDGRAELQLLRRQDLAAQGVAAAEGGIHEAVWRHAASGSAHWPADGVVRVTRVGAAEVTVRIDPLAGRLNPNIAPAGLIAALLARLGEPADRAEVLGAAAFDWHMPNGLASSGGSKQASYRAAGAGYAPPNQGFETDDEISAVLGWSAGLAAAMRPYLSIHNDGAIDRRLASPVLGLALEATGTNQPEAAVPSETIEITAIARLAGGIMIQRRAVARARAGKRFQFLDWGFVE